MNRGAAGACQKCSIECVNKQTGGKSLYFMCLVGGEVRMRDHHIHFLLTL